MSKLYIVPTPVGNLGDMTPRAVEVLQGVDLILAEDTRTSGVLLGHFGITTHAESHHKWNEHETVERIRRMYPAGTRVELVAMDDPQAPPAGTRGTIITVDDVGDLVVAWDNGSGLNVVPGVDRVRIITEEQG